MILGTISSVDSVNGLRVVVDGESSASTKKYSYLASYVPQASDRVIIEEINGSYVILGKIITEVADSGIVRQADNATNAVNAQNAQNAVNAQNATNATNATNAQNAALAANATSAEKCTGNSATSTVSNETKGFTIDVGSEQGQLVSFVQKQYSSQLGMYVVTDVQTGITHNYTYK